ncbi:HpcH/HpaI aldolase/citrate lyase family protein [Tissierella sp. MB52-C2]|uniref:HpcH/HpaI aldolase/citrate lyase family protein n=1 Tax=Tissierella sp. MB52-C2 TaxID=3070999 RepID=UPI00280AA144|nr:HpcH/HpaI aldolase/citrate lyase family protein [Tissierella sp. MB52-C2]WMM24190.1 HpcH/HpaI aldolase/citrate lyase family protein [Tissierella sp. MB52-C2]
MRHHQYNKNYEFVRQPEEFTKYTERNFLQYCLGATLYMPATKFILDSLLNNKLEGLTSLVMCFEDAIDKSELPKAEENVINILNIIAEKVEKNEIEEKDLPLFFLRVRSPEQFRLFSDHLGKKQIRLITGFVFPKFTTKNGYLYLSQLKDLNIKHSEILYGMPILESNEIVYKETRTYELTGIRNLLRPYKELILNLRVGATDFSSKFGVRRGMDYSIYDILMVRDALSDILNFLTREEDDYVISGPVWEYFLADKDTKFEDLNQDINRSLLKRNTIINEAIDGLLREVILDKANGFVGKTIIHPSHLKYVNAMQSVTREEYEDALQILDTSGGVIKSINNNKMNEINPHRNWAKKIYTKARAYGVIETESCYSKLFR